ncbi:MAG TPA: helix-turn-helix transcriptional regulator [Rhizomicrobium sp.]
MSKVENSTIRRGTANVFADLGYAEADTHLLKAELVARMQDVMTDRKLSQTAAASMVGVSQPDISRLLKGHYREVSVERIIRMLSKLGCEIDIVVKPCGKRNVFEAIHIAAIAAT